MALTTTNLTDWVNNLNQNPEDLVNILVGTGVEIITDSIQISQLSLGDSTDTQTTAEDTSDSPTTEENIPVTTAVIENGTDTLTYPLTLTVTVDGANGKATVNNDGTITYTPDPDFFGLDTYTYEINDANNDITSETVNVKVNPVTAVDDIAGTNEDTSVTTAVLNNDTDLDKELTVTTNGTNGTATVNDDGKTINYTPNLNFFGTDTFTYTIDYGNDATSSNTVSVSVDAEDIIDDTYTYTIDYVNGATSSNTVPVTTPVTIEGIDIFTVTTEPTNGTATVNVDGTITYTPKKDFYGNDTYTYTIDYGNGLTSSASVFVTVNPVNDPPEAGGDLAITDEDTPVITPVLDNDTDRDHADVPDTIELDPNAAHRAIGYFEGGLLDDMVGIGIDSGIILSTGEISDASGPNVEDNTGQALFTPGDSDLNMILDPESSDRDELADGDTNDAIFLEFDFVPENEEFTFEYVFASDEYNEFANSGFNDIFAFLLDGENIALIPSTTEPVSINNINAQENTKFFRNNDPSDVAEENLLDIEFDGLTTVLEARGFVTPGKTHHLKLVIADVSDSIYDSAVFLKAGSLSTPPTVNDATLTVNDREIVTINSNSEISDAKALLKFTLSGTDTNSINEVGVFEVDDDHGSIDGVLPGSANYTQLFLERLGRSSTSQSIFTGLAGSIMDGQNLSRAFKRTVGSKLGFYLITDGTSDTMLHDFPSYLHNHEPNILFSFPEANPGFQDPLKITGNDNGLTLSWEDDSRDNDYNDLVLTVETVDPSTIPNTNTALSSRRQGDIQKEIIDLSFLEDGETINANIHVWSETVFDNRVGLYPLEDAQGTVAIRNSEGEVVEEFTPDQSGYLEAAISQRVFEFDRNGEGYIKLEEDGSEEDSYVPYIGGNIELEQGYYAPYIIVNGTAEQWLDSNTNNLHALDTFAYVPFIDDGTTGQTNYDRVTLLGDNVFGFEDQLIALSDYDYNDMILKVDF
ncbi:MAG: choice-of-anchor L domain-containing protein [Xenococcus sp. MO_188.B8]|nr:choice-of-anchor L domain-containing protein [Xenococcus sp. MO_188.B8]